MSRINILVATTLPDIKARVIAESVADRYDMQLLAGQVLAADDVEEFLLTLSDSVRCGLVLVGPSQETNELARRCLTQRADLVVLQVDIVGDNVQIGFRDPRLKTLLNILRDLADRTDNQDGRRIARVQFKSEGVAVSSSAEKSTLLHSRPLLHAATKWIHAVLRDAVEHVIDDNRDAHGVALTRATLLQMLDRSATLNPSHSHADHAFWKTIESPHVATDPIAVLAQTFCLRRLELQLLLLALAPDLDVRFQLCIGFLQEDMSRRAGNINFYCSLLGHSPDTRAELAQFGALARWLAFENSSVVADEPLRLDSTIAQWLLGNVDALSADTRIQRAMRFVPWPGAAILNQPDNQEKAAKLLARFATGAQSQWLILTGDDSAGWRALLELGTSSSNQKLLRVELARFANVDLLEVEMAARLIGRMTLLTGFPLVVDATNLDGEGLSDRLDRFFETLSDTHCSGAVICRDPAVIVRHLGNSSVHIEMPPPISHHGRLEAIRVAAQGAHVCLSVQELGEFANRYPLPVDRLEQAMRLAVGSPLHEHEGETRLRRFTLACRKLAVEGLSNLADRIEPVFRMEDVVLPADRKDQLLEMIDHVRLAPKVLDGWKFGDQLPYGRSVTALFFGPSGTGKTMAAMGVARTLGVQLLRFDLSRMVSKYIGETEKNIDRVFVDAQRSGSAILIDEADALLGKRSDVKDAHDRYANIEIAYLLQRMETYEGLAILTTNMRQNLDAAFLRRLRFIVDFPRPDVAAREQIWRFCLPVESHCLDDTAFRHLARKVDLTGGHIRQITLRAAFIAAAAGVRIHLEHIATAARAEFTKLGMPPAEIDLNLGRRAA